MMTLPFLAQESAMPNRRSFLAGGAAAALAAQARAQTITATATTTTTPVDDSGRPVDPPPPGFYSYRGISGPGLPVTDASAGGGWISGGDSVRYQGPQIVPYPTVPWGDASSG